MRFWFKNKAAGFSADTCEKYRDYLFKIALRIAGDKFYAEDIVQETMCKLIRVAPTLADKTEAEIRKYMVKAVINNGFTYMKKALRERPADKLPMETSEDLVWEAVLAAATKEQLAEALRQVTHKQRIVLVLMFYENWSTEQIADWLGISSDGVRMLKKRGLENMREILRKEGWEE